MDFKSKYNSYLKIMNTSIQEINNIVLNKNNEINGKIIGINYLEKLKYLIIENFKILDKSIFENLLVDLKNNGNKPVKLEFKDFFLISSIHAYKDSLSKIKSPYNHDILSIVINGFKTVSIFDSNKNNKSISLFISKNMGLVLSKNTITSEIIASGSIILDIIFENQVLNIEN